MRTHGARVKSKRDSQRNYLCYVAFECTMHILQFLSPKLNECRVVSGTESPTSKLIENKRNLFIHSLLD